MVAYDDMDLEDGSSCHGGRVEHNKCKIGSLNGENGRCHPPPPDNGMRGVFLRSRQLQQCEKVVALQLVQLYVSLLK